jgi:hypothetical protein
MFGRVFASLWEGSMVGKSDLQLVFIFLLAKADAGGCADYHPTVISAMTGIAEDRVRQALMELEGPDPESRSEKLGGARLERLSEHRDWGWHIVNWEDYRAIRSLEDRRQRNREAQARRRAKINDASPVVIDGHRESVPSAHTDTDTDTESTTLSIGDGRDGQESLKDWEAGFEFFWGQYPRKVAKESARRAYMKLRRTQETYDSLFAGLKWYTDSVWANRAEDKIEHAATWINQRRFEDAQATISDSSA